MLRAIIINKYLSEMSNVPNVEANNNSSHSDQYHISEPNEDVKSQSTPSLQTHVNPEQISNNVQNALSPEVLNIDPQSQPEVGKINEQKENAILSQKSEILIRTNLLFQKLTLL